MSRLYVYTLFDHKTGKPRCTGIKDGNIIKICDLYRPGAGKTIKKIDTTKNIIRKVIMKANSEGRDIVLSDFKSHITAFDLPRDHRTWNVYDLHLPDIQPSNSLVKDSEIIHRIIDRMTNVTINQYQNIIAQAAIVYQDIEDNGLLINCDPVWPKWSQKTFSGRSKTTGFNIQGLHDDFHVTPQGCGENDVMINFDWICADIRVASLISEDDLLQSAFEYSDPYTVLMNEINSDSEDQITREECKRYLLKSINSMDISSAALQNVYRKLGAWIGRSKFVANSGKPLETILGRKFRLAHSKNILAVINGVMQGSVAHAMQLSLRRVWDKLPSRIVTEIHDCLVVTSAPDAAEINATIDIISQIMLRPFKGVLDNDPVFPLNVSIGKKWKKWKLYRVYRESGITNANKTKKKTIDSAESDQKEEEAETQEE